LHGQAETDRYGRARGALPPEVRQDRGKARGGSREVTTGCADRLEEASRGRPLSRVATVYPPSRDEVAHMKKHWTDKPRGPEAPESPEWPPRGACVPARFAIGPVEVRPATVLAPMAGVTDTIFRRFIRNASLFTPSGDADRTIETEISNQQS